ncbi:MAG: tetratricopeptide repeat protein [Oligoflexales bacterium]
MKLRRLFFLLLCVGCQTNPQSPSDASELDSYSSPSEIWSPRQRASVAGYSYLLGEYMSLYGRRGADQFLQRAYDLEPNAFLGRKVLLARARVQPTVDVLASARRMILLYPKDAELRMIYARLLSLVKDWEEAEKQGQEAMRLQPALLSRALMIELYVKQKKYQSALKIARKIIQTEPKEKSGWLVLSRLYFLTENPSRALRATTLGLKHHPDSLKLSLMKAWSLEKTEKSLQAAKLFEALFKNHADEHLVPTLLALYKDIGSLDDALDVLTRLSKKFKGRYPEVDLQRVFVFWELKNYKKAAQTLDEILARKNHGSRLLYLAALGHEKIGDFQQALILFEKIEKGSRFFPHGLYRSALLYKQRKNYVKALQKLQQLNQSSSAHWQGFGLAASIYAEQEQLDQAFEVIAQGLLKFPKSTSLAFQKGVWQEQMGDVEDCIETMENIIESEPMYAPALNYIGYLYAERGENLDKAERYIRRALVVRPMDGYYLDSLGWVFYQREQFVEAEKLFRKALEYEPEEGVIMEHLADTLLAQKKRTLAKKWYEKSLKGTLDASSRERIQEKISDLRD